MDEPNEALLEGAIILVKVDGIWWPAYYSQGYARFWSDESRFVVKLITLKHCSAISGYSYYKLL